nr:MAG TPA: hypothetical protein [Caudoviricetes sp.]
MDKTITVAIRLSDNNLTQRFRAGIKVSNLETTVNVTAEQLEALKNDPYILVRELDAQSEPQVEETPATEEAEEAQSTQEEDNKEDEEEADGKHTVKSLLRKNLDEIREIATGLGVEFKEETTKKELAEAIVAKQ